MPPSAERLAWLTGFTGSAGTAVVLADKAAIFVDGRYTLQVREQVDTAVVRAGRGRWRPPSRMAEARKPKGGSASATIPGCMTRSAGAPDRKGAARRPAARLSPSTRIRSTPSGTTGRRRRSPPVSQQPDDARGTRRRRKDRGSRATALAEKRADAAVLTDPASIAWLFNIRGGDVPHTPLPALLRRSCTPRGGRSSSSTAASSRTRCATGSEGSPTCSEAGDFADAAAARSAGGKRSPLRRRTARRRRSRGSSRLPAGRWSTAPIPVALPKARKNAAELAGTRAAHLRDGVAMLRFLRFIERARPAR